MWTFLGLCVIAYVVWAELRRISRILGGLCLIFERLGNRAAERQGDPPVLTPEDVKEFV